MPFESLHVGVPRLEPDIANETMTVLPTGTAAVATIASLVPVILEDAFPIEVGIPIAAHTEPAGRTESSASARGMTHQRRFARGFRPLLTVFAPVPFTVRISDLQGQRSNVEFAPFSTVRSTKLFFAPKKARRNKDLARRRGL